MMEPEKRKIIIIGAEEQISSAMRTNIMEHYGCEIEIISSEEYQKRQMEEEYQKRQIVDLAAEALDKIMEELTIEFRKTENDNLLLSQRVAPKPEPVRKIGKVNNKKFAPAPKQYYRQRRGR